MSWLITPRQLIPTVIGEAFGGGYFAGYISHTADGNPTHALIVAPRATGATGTGYPVTTNLQWKTSATTTAGAFSGFDGAINTALMISAGIGDHPAAQFCVNLNIGGFTDWYLPTRTELRIAYFNLKPSTLSNTAGQGVNPYHVPPITQGYTASYPPQTEVPIFRTFSSQPFQAGGHVTSTQASATQYGLIVFDVGQDFSSNKTGAERVRAFRKIAL